MREFTIEQENKASRNNARAMREAMKARDIARNMARNDKKQARAIALAD